MSKSMLVNIGTEDSVKERKIVNMNTFKKIVKHIEGVKLARIKNVTKDIEKLAETGWEKVVGENKTVHICTRIQKRQKEKHFRKVAAITSITEAPEAKAEVNIIQLISTNVVGTEALEAEALEI